MRLSLAIALALVLVAAGCGHGNGLKTKFTNANWEDVEFTAQSGKWNGTPVDVVGRVFLVDNNEADGMWFALYPDSAQSFKALVKYPDTSFEVQENQLVHVVGKIEQSLEKPQIIMWDTEPVVLASKATIVPG